MIWVNCSARVSPLAAGWLWSWCVAMWLLECFRLLLGHCSVVSRVCWSTAYWHYTQFASSKLQLIPLYVAPFEGTFFFSGLRKSGHLVHSFNPIIHCITECTNYGRSTAVIPVIIWGNSCVLPEDAVHSRIICILILNSLLMVYDRFQDHFVIVEAYQIL